MVCFSFYIKMYRIKIHSIFVSFSLLLVASNLNAETVSEVVARPDWKKYFDNANVEGTILIVDEREGKQQALVYNRKRSQKRFKPASTFKIPHALFALDSMVIRDEFEVFPWDGVKRSYEAWNKNQTLRSSMRHSVVWVYEGFAESIGPKAEKAYMSKISYGNCDPSGTAPFWIKGNLRISAREQLDFLQKLYRNELPFSRAHQRLVKDVMVVEAQRDWILRAKTGWSGKIGWWIGWVEHSDGAVFFVMNIDTPKGHEKFTESRRDIARDIDIS